MSPSQTRDTLPGLPSERTALAWERTSLGLLGNAALLLLRDSAREPLLLVAAGTALALAVVTSVIARRRAARIQRDGRLTEPTREIQILTVGVSVFAISLCVVSLFG